MSHILTSLNDIEVNGEKRQIEFYMTNFGIMMKSSSPKNKTKTN